MSDPSSSVCVPCSQCSLRELLLSPSPHAFQHATGGRKAPSGSSRSLIQHCCQDINSAMAPSALRQLLLTATCIFLTPYSALAAQCWRVGGPDPALFPYCHLLSPTYALHWRLSNDTVTFAADVDGQVGWLKLSWAEAGRKGVDSAVIIRGQAAGTWLMRDYFADIDLWSPHLDAQQDFTLNVAPVQDQSNRTYAIFSRKFDTCDTEDVLIPVDVQLSLFWSYGANWGHDVFNLGGAVQGGREVTFRPAVIPANTTTSFVSAAGALALANATAIAAGMKNATAPVTVVTFPVVDPLLLTLNLTLPMVTVPAARTTLWCTNFALPSDKPYHIVGLAGNIVQSELVHHIALHTCSAGAVPGDVGPVYDCMTGVPIGCEPTQFMWGRGTLPWIAPSAAGFRIGNGSTTYVVMQVHYDNPDGLSNLVDASGLSLSITPTLRPHDLGVLLVGSYDIAIPPGQSSYAVTPNVCPGSCTASRITPNSSITLVSNFFYMKSYGRSIRTRHIRNGSALQPVGWRQYYDDRAMVYLNVFNGSRTMLPGDALITRCIYNTTAVDSNITVAGSGAGMEACQNYMFYYPAANVTSFDTCIAAAATNTASCSTATTLAAVKANATSLELQIKLGILVSLPNPPLNVTPWRSDVCRARDDEEFIPDYIYNFKKALASIILVPCMLCLVGYIIFVRHNKEEEIAALLESLKNTDVMNSIMAELADEQLQEVLLAQQKAQAETLRQQQEAAAAAGLEVKTIPDQPESPKHQPESPRWHFTSLQQQRSGSGGLQNHGSSNGLNGLGIPHAQSNGNGSLHNGGGSGGSHHSEIEEAGSSSCPAVGAVAGGGSAGYYASPLSEAGPAELPRAAMSVVSSGLSSSKEPGSNSERMSLLPSFGTSVGGYKPSHE